MQKLSGILILVFLFIKAAVFSQDNLKYYPVSNLQEVEQKLNANSAKINSIKSDFIQEKHLEFLNDTIITKGKFWFQKENLLRWEYTSPFKYIIVINNGKFIVKDDDKVSEFDINSNKAFQQVNNLIISSVKGSLMEENMFEIKAFKNETTYLLALVPKDINMKNVLNKIELYFDAETLDVIKVKMIENEQDYTIISFINKKYNETIPSNTFIVN
jgi:outer membrane lipoprotein-sorting protein